MKTKAVRLAISGEGTHWAAAEAGGQGTVLVWQRDVRDPIHKWAFAATALAFSREAALLAAGDENGRVRVWSVRHGQAAATFTAGRTAIQSLAFSADGRRLAIAGSGGALLLWEHGSQQTTQLFGSEYDVNAVAFSPDGTLLASGGRSPTRLWDVASGRLLLEIDAGDYITALTFSGDGDLLVVSSRERGTKMWQVRDGRGVRTLRGLASPIVQVQFSVDDSSLAALSQSARVAVWRLPSGQLWQIREAPRAQYPDNAALAFSSDGRRLAVSAGTEGRLWDLERDTERSWRLPLPGLAEMLTFSPTGKLLLFRMDSDSGRRLGRVRDLLGPCPLEPIYEVEGFSHVLAASVSAEARCFLIAGNGDKSQEQVTRVKALDAETGRVRWQHQLSKRLTSMGLCIDPLGRVAAVSPLEEDVPATLVDISDGTILHRLAVIPTCLGPDFRLFLHHGPADRSGALPVQALRRPGDPAPLVFLAIDALPTLRPTFNRTGTLVAWGNPDGTVTLCELQRIHARLNELGLGW